MATKVSDFQSIRLKLASPEEILSWSHGEVTKPETINYRTQRPEKDGLFCEKIFGPEKDWECYCGKYRRIRYKGVICDRCGVEVTRAIVRRERMGHISLAVPVSHIWFLRGIPSKMGLLLDKSVQDLEKVIYFVGYIITRVDEEARKKAVEEIEREYKAKLKAQSSKFKKTELNYSLNRAEGSADQPLTGSAPSGNNLDDSVGHDLQHLKEQRDRAIRQVRELHRLQILSELEYRDLSMKYGQVFEAGTGAETLRKIFEEINLEALAKELSEQVRGASPVLKRRILRRLRLVENLIRAKIRPEWMFLTVLPVLPPDLRPMVQLDGGRYATSDVNDLYRRVINRNNRLKRLLELRAPEVICRNEKRMLQEAVDALIDNTARRGQGAVTATTGQRRVLKSLADMLKGKQGRFRQNLLGKRVDYSGRSVIVVGPDLKLHQCGLPKHMALELFKPFVINKLVERGLAYNVRGAGHLIEQETDEVWSILEEVIKDKYVLLNRAPTLHRLGIQAFQPVLIEGQAIQIHPLVCRAFNADFDGDQMAVHLPLTKPAQKEAKEVMLSSLNLLKPASGQPVAFPTQDMVLGCYWMTQIEDGLKGEGKIFTNPEEAILAYHFREVELRSRIKVRIETETETEKETEKKETKSLSQIPLSPLIETSVGRIIFNEPLPPEIGFLNKTMNQKELRRLVAELINKCGINKAALVLDRMKRMGFKYATMSGITWSMDDLKIPPGKEKLLKEAEREVQLIQSQYEQGFLTDEERKTRVIQIWLGVKEKIAQETPLSLDVRGPIYSIFDSGSRGSRDQLVQMAGMKGLVVSPTSETIELPVKSSLKEGFNVLEYFISTHGARKGLTDTALKTSSAGYLTRRLVDVCQDIVVREEDCRDKKGITIYKEDEEEIGHSLAERIVGRVALEEIKIQKSKIKNTKAITTPTYQNSKIIKTQKEEILVKPGQLIDQATAKKIEQAGIDKIRVRSVITCQTQGGICQKCYGYDLGHNQLVKLGQAVGIVTAQAIGEPGTQLTLRTFHTGGVAGGGDITQGLPRVEEIFEVRPPKGRAVISEVDGQVVDIVEKGEERIIKIKNQKSKVKMTAPAWSGQAGAGRANQKSKLLKVKKSQKEKKEILEYAVPRGVGIWVSRGDLVSRGQQLIEGHIDLRELYKTAGQEAVQRYIIKEVQAIYTAEGERINDKHIEMIIRQMFSRVRIKDPGQTNLLPGQVVERAVFERANAQLKAKKTKTKPKLATAQPLLLGITKVSLSSDSFLSAASFQETAKVLINAAVEGKEDHLRGLKENVIIGKLIPAGTGFSK